MSLEAILTMTELVTEKTTPVVEMMMLGAEIEVLISGPLFNAPDDSTLVTTVPLALGGCMLKVGSI
jgi:hypothetical protein